MVPSNSQLDSASGQQEDRDLVVGRALSNVEWVQIGPNLNSEKANDIFGHFVALSEDGSRIAVGAPLNDAGHANAYDWDDTRNHLVGPFCDTKGPLFVEETKARNCSQPRRANNCVARRILKAMETQQTDSDGFQQAPHIKQPVRPKGRCEIPSQNLRLSYAGRSTSHIKDSSTVVQSAIQKQTAGRK
jgi:hypothetical protein